VPARAPSAELDLTIPQRTLVADSETLRKSILKDRSKVMNPGKNNDTSKKGQSENLKRLPNRMAIGHPTNLEVAEYSQRVMTDEVQKVEVDEMNRAILLNRCHVVKIDHGVPLRVAGVTVYPWTIVMEIARTTIVAIEIAVNLATIDAIDQDEGMIRRLMTIQMMAVTSSVMIARQMIMN